VMKHYSPTGRRNHGRPLKRLLDAWDRNGSTSGPTPWQIYDDDDKNQLDALFILSLFRHSTSICFGHICKPIINMFQAYL
jgi:hypothetical protein